MIMGFKNIFPSIAKKVYISENAVVIGNVELKDFVSVWPNAVLRGDEGNIIIGKYSNIQDNCTLHTDKGGTVEIGEYVTVGHNSIVHGCKIKNNVIVGMGSVILNNAEIGNNCIIGAGAVVLQNTVVPDNSLVLGIPAKIKSELKPEQIAAIKENALVYWSLAEEYLNMK
ncbi:MAG: gamma carbonic anhydrase family protein [Candidatus Odinarchaeia archaeon]